MRGAVTLQATEIRCPSCGDGAPRPASLSPRQ